jgi:hypothetical protein
MRRLWAEVCGVDLGREGPTGTAATSRSSVLGPANRGSLDERGLREQVRSMVKITSQPTSSASCSVEAPSRRRLDQPGVEDVVRPLRVPRLILGGGLAQARVNDRELELTRTPRRRARRSSSKFFRGRSASSPSMNPRPRRRVCTRGNRRPSGRAACLSRPASEQALRCGPRPSRDLQMSTQRR